MNQPYDAVLLVSFGGPDGPDDVIPFLENVLRGRNVPQERMAEVAEHYYLFGGESPINSQNRALLVDLVNELRTHGLDLPVYWGNRNWHPLLTDAVQEMADDGVCHALALVTSAFGSYSGCRQYQEDIQLARQAVGAEAPKIDKLRLFYNHPGFIEPMAAQVQAALDELPAERREAAPLVFTAHSVPQAMAASSPYQQQLAEACRLVAERVGRDSWDLVYQSRGGPPSQPWLEPDIKDHLRQLHAAEAIQDVVVVPLGFLSEHMEVIYDLDYEAGSLCDELGINMVRAGVVGNHPRFIQMIRELIVERIDSQAPRLALGTLGPSPDACPADCCQLHRPS